VKVRKKERRNERSQSQPHLLKVDNSAEKKIFTGAVKSVMMMSKVKPMKIRQKPI
jgi:hypothetical protein